MENVTSAVGIEELDLALADLDLNSDSVPALAAGSPPPTSREDKPHVGEILPPKSKTAQANDFYAAIAPADAQALRTAEKNIRKYGKAIGDSILKIGGELLLMKKAMPGVFVQWTKEKLDFDTRTAQRYMKAAEAFGNAPKVVEKLPGDIVYALASDSTPDALRADIVAEVNSGKVPTRADIMARIKAAKGGTSGTSAPKAAAATASNSTSQSVAETASRVDAETAAQMLADDFAGDPEELLALLQAVNPVEFLEELKAVIKA